LRDMFQPWMGRRHWCEGKAISLGSQVRIFV
jgi:hypothetical protein